MSNWFTKKLPSGALQLTIFIAAIIAILLAAVITLTYVHRFFIEQSKASIQVVQETKNGFLFLSENSSERADTLIHSPERNSNIQIRTHTSYWGVFEKGWVETTHRNKKFVKVGLIGSSFSEEDRTTLYLKETFKPLVVVGTTAISGKSFLPEQGVRSGTIAGESYYGNQLINGATRLSSQRLPEIGNLLKKNLSQIISSDVLERGENYLELNNPKGVNSFHQPTKYLKSKDKITLENRILLGNIIVKSDTLVVIKKTATIKDIIVIAPYVEIQEGFEGTLQVFSSKAIYVHKKCTLNYPSALIVIQDEKQPLVNPSQQHQIFIDSGSVVSGTVCYFNSLLENDFRTQVVIQTDAQVAGEVYCEGNIELMGWIKGTLYTHQFVSNKAGSVFINHLFNGTLSIDAIPQAFAGIHFKEMNQFHRKKAIIKWLY